MQFEKFDRKTARAIGIEYLPQLLPRPANLTALEFLALAQPRDEFLFRPWGIRHAAEKVIVTHSAGFNLGLLDRSLAQLSDPDLRRLYLVRALMSGARLLILDEPTAGLSEEEAQKLILTLGNLAGRPRSTHDASSGSEVRGSTGKAHYALRANAQLLSIIVLTLGNLAGRPRSTHDASSGSGMRGSTSKAHYAMGANGQLLSIIVIAHPIQLMSMPSKVRQLTSHGLEEVPSPLLMRQYSSAQRIPVHPRWAPRPLPLGAAGSIELRSGKIVTIVGETSQEFYGCFAAARRTLRQMRDLVVREIPFDAIESGLAPSLPAYENCLVNRWRDDKRWIRYGHLIRSDQVREWLAKPIVETLRVTLKSVDSPVAHLSGGNKQLLLIGRELWGRLDILIAGDLFRGLSDERVEDVIKLILSKATGGTCLVLFSVTPRFEELLSDETFRFERGRLNRIEKHTI